MAHPKSLSLRDAVLLFLQSHPGQEFKSRELADGLQLTFPARFEGKAAQQIAAEIGAGGPQWLLKCSGLHRSEEAPRRYWWADECSPTSIDTPVVEPESAVQSEHDLYPLLATFLISRHRKIYPKLRIPLMADSDSIPIADSVPGDGGHLARGS